MTIAVVGAAAVVDVAGTGQHPSTELVVAGTDAAVDDVGAHVAGRVVVDVGAVQRAIALVDAIQTPGGVALGGVEKDHAVLFDVGHPWIVQQLLDGCIGRAGREAGQGGIVDVFNPKVEARCKVHGDVGHIARYVFLRHGRPAASEAGRTVRGRILEYHDVLAFDRKLRTAKFRCLDRHAQAEHYCKRNEAHDHLDFPMKGWTVDVSAPDPPVE